MAVSVSTGGGDMTASGVYRPAYPLSDRRRRRPGHRGRRDQVSADTGGGDIEIVFTQVPRNVRVSTGAAATSRSVARRGGGTDYHVAAAQAGGDNVDDPVPLDSSSPNLITATSGGGDITISECRANPPRLCRKLAPVITKRI